eukprot:m.255454 g.255454  ORF g.255454 m.255454 type:complete len:50 (+) comp40396_c0_seq3:3474-3623(+)
MARQVRLQVGEAICSAWAEQLSTISWYCVVLIALSVLYCGKCIKLFHEC